MIFAPVDIRLPDDTGRQENMRRPNLTPEHCFNTFESFAESYPFYLFYRGLSVLHSGAGKNITLFTMCENIAKVASNPSTSTIDQEQLNTTSVRCTYREQDRIEQP